MCWLILLPQNQQDKRRLIKRLFFLWSDSSNKRKENNLSI
ncbi:hypothetical protein HMPREF1345_01591 [Enterococcus faecium TX1337RF]|nr:hypothetical protein HMPREF1345_01591 [Enterococcus faecium TX1337RF]